MASSPIPIALSVCLSAALYIVAKRFSETGFRRPLRFVQGDFKCQKICQSDAISKLNIAMVRLTQKIGSLLVSVLTGQLY